LSPLGAPEAGGWEITDVRPMSNSTGEWSYVYEEDSDQSKIGSLRSDRVIGATVSAQEAEEEKDTDCRGQFPCFASGIVQNSF